MPDGLLSEVEEVVARTPAFTSAAEFVRVAVTRLLKELKRDAPTVGAEGEVEKAEEVPVG